MSSRGHLIILGIGAVLVLLGCWLWLRHGLLVAWNSFVSYCF